MAEIRRPRQSQQPSPSLLVTIESIVSPNVIARMQTEIYELRARVAALEQEAEAIRASEEVVVLRTVSREEGKQEIKRLFEQGGTWYYSDIARQLRLELPLVVELCQELEEEGEIETDADNAV